MTKVMVQFQYSGHAPSVEEVVRIFDICADEIDPNFGVIATDPEAGLYTILVKQKVADNLNGKLKQGNENSAFSNPRIEPFGPPKK